MLQGSPKKRIYDALVIGPDDILGLISYSLYKRHKIEFIKDFQAQNNDVPPDEKELGSFYNAAGTDSSISRYKNAASELVTEFVHEMLAEETDSVHEEYQQKIEEIGRLHAEKIEALRASYDDKAQESIRRTDELVREHNRVVENINNAHGAEISEWQRKFEGLSPSFRAFVTGVSQSLLGSFLFVLTIGFLIFLIQSSRLGLKEVVETIFEVEIVESGGEGQKSGPEKIIPDKIHDQNESTE